VNLLQSYNITPTNSVGMAGDWRLEVYDAYRGDTGKIDSWSITFN
ncbi:MAG: hypothetical protein GY808_18900, partial [Gammaproteobacteria bacterium]|nr:hypothetical protein [Gammaproteobacteria bacterium]